MNDSNKPSWKERLAAWVDGDQTSRDRTLYIMEQRQPRSTPRTEEEHEAREQRRLHLFINWYPAAALVLCGVLTTLLLVAVLGLPSEGQVQLGESLAAGSWELELLGESCLLFLSISGVRLLLRGRKEDRQLLKTWNEVPHQHLAGGLLLAAALLVVLVGLLGGIAGGALTGALVGVPALLTHGRLLRCRGYGQAGSLLLCLGLSGVSIYAGTNGLVELELAAAKLLELAAGMSAAFAVYSVCSLAAENRPAAD